MKLFIPCLLAALLMAGCGDKKAPDNSAETERAELTKVRSELMATQKQLQAREDELELAKENLEQAKNNRQEMDKQLAERDTRLTALELQLDNLKKQDGQVYRGLAEMRQRGHTPALLNLYRMFLQDFPQSPLAPDAERTIDSLFMAIHSGETDNSDLPLPAGPKRKDDDLKRRLSYGSLTTKELVPVLKNKTSHEVETLFGQPEHIFPNGDWSYSNRAIDDKTGQKGILIISFNAGKVSSLRVGYTGQKYSP